MSKSFNKEILDKIVRAYKKFYSNIDDKEYIVYALDYLYKTPNLIYVSDLFVLGYDDNYRVLLGRSFDHLKFYFFLEFRVHRLFLDLFSIKYGQRIEIPRDLVFKELPDYGERLKIIENSRSEVYQLSQIRFPVF